MSRDPQAPTNWLSRRFKRCYERDCILRRKTHTHEHTIVNLPCFSLVILEADYWCLYYRLRKKERNFFLSSFFSLSLTIVHFVHTHTQLSRDYFLWVRGLSTGTNQPTRWQHQPLHPSTHSNPQTSPLFYRKKEANVGKSGSRRAENSISVSWAQFQEDISKICSRKWKIGRRSLSSASRHLSSPQLGSEVRDLGFEFSDNTRGLAASCSDCEYVWPHNPPTNIPEMVYAHFCERIIETFANSLAVSLDTSETLCGGKAPKLYHYNLKSNFVRTLTSCPTQWGRGGNSPAAVSTRI